MLVEPTAPARQPVPAARAIKASAAAPAFASFWDFALAINRSDAAALKQAANGLQARYSDRCRRAEKAPEHLLVSVSVFASFTGLAGPLTSIAARAGHDPQLRDQDRATHRVNLSELTDAQRRQVLNTANLPDAIRADFQLVVAVAMLWGEDAVKRFALTAASDAPGASTLSSLLQSFRQS